MTEETRPFTQELIRPFADQGELPLLIQAQTEEAHSESWDETALIERLSQPALPTPRPLLWSSVIFILIAFFSLTIVGGLKGYRAYHMFSAIQFYTPVESFYKNKKTFTAQEQILLSGDPTATSSTEQWEPLRRLDEEKPAYAIPYFNAHFNEHGNFPSEVQKFREDHDPTNSWYDLREAAALVDSCITQNSISTSPKTPSKAQPVATYTITNQTKYDDALALLIRARSAQTLTNHSATLWAERYALFDPPKTLQEQSSQICYAASELNPSFLLFKITKLISAHAQQLAQEGRPEELRALVVQNDFISSHLLQESRTILDVLIARAYPLQTTKALAQAAGQLNLTALKDTLQKRSDNLHDHYDELRNQPSNPALTDLIEQKGSLIANMSLPAVYKAVKEAPPLTTKDLQPGVRTERAILAQLATVISVVLLSLAALTLALSPFFLGRVTHLLGQRLTSLVTGREFLWFLLKSSLLPVALFLSLRYFTDCFAPDDGLFSGKPLYFAPMFSPFLLLLCLLLIIPVIESRLLINHIFSKPNSWRQRWPYLLAPLIAASPLAASCATGVTAYNIAITSYVLIAILLIYLAISFFHLFSKHPTHRFYRAPRLKLILPALALSVMATALTYLAYQAEEHYWVPKNQLMTVSQNGFSTFEDVITKQMKAELHELYTNLSTN